MQNILRIFICLIVMHSYVDASVVQFVDNDDLVLQRTMINNRDLHNADSLRIYLINQGYLDVSIIEVLDTFKITTSQKYKLRNLFIEPLSKASVQSNIDFTQENVSKLFEKILDHEKSQGYQFATILVDSTFVTEYKVDLFGNLNRGPITKIDSLKFEGLTKTKQNMLYKYFSFDDTIITPETLRQIEKDALAIPFVQFTPPIKQEIQQGYASANLIIPFVEKSNFIFEGGGGYLSEQELFLWNLSLRFQNIFGSGQNISIVSQKKDKDNQQLSLGYQQPLFLLGTGVAELQIETRDYRNDFYEFVLSAGINSYYKKKINLGFSGRYKSVELEQNNLSYRSAQLSFAISNKESFATVVKNKLMYGWKFSYGNRKYRTDSLLYDLSSKSYNESRIEIRNKFNASIKHPTMLMIATNFQSYQTDEPLPPFAELYLVGGAGSIRGFKDEQFASIRNLTMTVEPQYHFNSGNLFLFYDAGYMYNRLSAESSEYLETTFYRFGYGGGIAFSSNDNFLKLSFGWNKSLNFDNPRISIELKTGL